MVWNSYKILNIDLNYRSDMENNHQLEEYSIENRINHQKCPLNRVKRRMEKKSEEKLK
jgi:hypothetical protein